MATSTSALYLVRPQPVSSMAPANMPVLMWGLGTPDGDADPWKSAQKGSIWIQIDANDDVPHAMIKVDSGDDDSDWMYLTVSATNSALTGTSGSAASWA